MKNELSSLVMSLVAVTIFLAVVLLVGACQDDHEHNIFIPPDTLPTMVVCDTTPTCKPAPPDTVWCYREKQNGNYVFTCEAEKRDD